MEGKTELQRNAIVGARNKELEIFQRALDMQWMNNRMEDGRMGRCLALVKREAKMEKDYQERTDHAAIVNTRAKQETALGMEVANVRREEACALLRRHYLRERDPELRELGRKLQAAYVCRDLRQQILHNEYKRLQEKAEEKFANTVLQNAVYNEQEQKEREDRKHMEQTSKYRQELQQQLVNRQREKQCQYEDSLIEKKMLDDILRTISDEDQRELQQKREITDRMRREMVTFQQARQAWRDKQKQMVVNEEKDIERQNKMAADRYTAILEERQRKLREKDAINAKICAKIAAEEEERQQRSDIIMLLQEQEYLEKNIQDDIAEKAKFERVKEDTKRALTAQMNERREIEAQQKVVELEFRKETEQKVAEEEKKERDKQSKVREKNRKYAELLMQQVRDKERQKLLEQKGLEDRAKYVADYNRKWDEEVKNERKKIIKEHVPQLLGYLQAGVIKKEDLPTVREGANKNPELAKLDIEALVQSTKPKRFPKCNAQCRILRNY